MPFYHQKFLQLLPLPFVHLMNFLIEKNFIVTIVGGIVRDFILFQKMGDDFDVEISHETLSFNEEIWRNLGQSLSQFGDVSFLAYEVIRVKINHIEIELTPPRKELFYPLEHPKAQGHSNFDAVFDFSLPFNQSLLRRDFSINAMGVRMMGEGKLMFTDPLHALDHLEQKVLSPVSANFVKDPVRFLRAFRFSLNLEFQFSETLKTYLKSMDCSELKAYSVWQEMMKSHDPFEFLRQLLFFENKSLILPIDQQFFLSNQNSKKLITSPQSQTSWLIALEWVGKGAKSWGEYFSVGKSLILKVQNWVQLSLIMKDLSPYDFHQSFDDVKKADSFETLFSWFKSTQNFLKKDRFLYEFIKIYLPQWCFILESKSSAKNTLEKPPAERGLYDLWWRCQKETST